MPPGILMLIGPKKKGGLADSAFKRMMAGKGGGGPAPEPEEEPKTAKEAGLAHAEAFAAAVKAGDAADIFEHFEGMKKACDELAAEGGYEDDEDEDLDDEDEG